MTQIKWYILISPPAQNHTVLSALWELFVLLLHSTEVKPFQKLAWVSCVVAGTLICTHTLTHSSLLLSSDFYTLGLLQGVPLWSRSSCLPALLSHSLSLSLTLFLPKFLCLDLSPTSLYPEPLLPHFLSIPSRVVSELVQDFWLTLVKKNHAERTGIAPAARKLLFWLWTEMSLSDL